ncbi:MAG: 50S ribosomal protein L11 methyltransferase [Rhodospirillaceae bacterium]
MASPNLSAEPAGSQTPARVSAALAPIWKLSVTAPLEAVSAIEAVLEPHCSAVTWFEIQSGPEAEAGLWKIEGMAEAPPTPADITPGIALAAAAFHIPEPSLFIEKLEGRDWLTENLLSFPPMQIGRFRVVGSHITDPAPSNLWPVLVDAATAFGSGDHPSTKGCLKALGILGRRRHVFRPRRVLDMGTGSGILSIAAARQWRGCRVMASDIDAESVRVARFNVARNGLGSQIRCAEGDGLAAAGVRSEGPYDLILANILARPLRSLAGPMLALSATGAYAILAGLLIRQENMVLEAWRAHGMVPVHRLHFDPWSTLILRRP